MKNRYLSFPEMLETISGSKESVVESLQKFKHNKPFLEFLRLAYDPNILFDVDVPEYKRDEHIPVDFAYSSMASEMRRMYIFLPEYQKISGKRKGEILCQMLESFDTSEATLLGKLINKKIEVPELSKELLEEVFPELFKQTHV